MIEIPDQVWNTLTGKDVVIIPPEMEGVMPMPAEEFVMQHAPELIDMGMLIARDHKGTNEEATWMLFNPKFHNQGVIKELADSGRLSEYANGAGNHTKPDQATHVVKVTSKNGEPVRDVLIANPQQAASAISRNSTSGNNVEVAPANPEELSHTLLKRVQNIGPVGGPTASSFTPGGEGLIAQ